MGAASDRVPCGCAGWQIAPPLTEGSVRSANFKPLEDD